MIGYRVWCDRPIREWEYKSSSLYSVAIASGPAWTAGVNTAACFRGHPAPAPGCWCGLWCFPCEEPEALDKARGKQQELAMSERWRQLAMSERRRQLAMSEGWRQFYLEGTLFPSKLSQARYIIGAVRYWGHAIVHTSGVRAQHAQIMMLLGDCEAAYEAAKVMDIPIACHTAELEEYVRATPEE